ncbi:MAG: SagB/ThcOx family dehydrogenase [Oscillospiraceae bacterium]|nr:SagB/ThcOx family dehydrogenase [Oscillospiraceae bacterium]
MSEDIRNLGLWEEIKPNRDFMKCKEFSVIMENSDQSKKLPQPPLCNAAKGEVITISADFSDVVTHDSYSKLLDIRRSERVYDTNQQMTQAQFAFLLWSCHGIQEIRGDSYCTLRPVPSGGARHAFELYIAVRNVEGLKPGIYHYLPLENIGSKDVTIEFLYELPNHDETISEMTSNQKWSANTAVVLFLSCVAYRAEWRYSTLSHRVALIDSGHIGQNMMLSVSAMGMGSCNIAAFNQALCDKHLGLDGFEEFTVYATAVGFPKKT